MDKRDEQYEEDKRKIEEYTKNPMINLADSINRSMIGDLNGLTKGGFVNKLITTIIIIGILFLFSRGSN
ncbi:hypothetical protein [Natronincola ferrireducens]|uniref:Uncharacterized protein n=1 Tax=Natronincola ferrireducens TaxID=393762 RepID=A0A1G9GW78_9FIRM|nr:hypothetical protein [Natronincola ferrireducens]SDL04941.1 hypothetical protein SAMN05660472_02507 [Natronincola ferrireducens]